MTKPPAEMMSLTNQLVSHPFSTVIGGNQDDDQLCVSKATAAFFYKKKEGRVGAFVTLSDKS